MVAVSFNNVWKDYGDGAIAVKERGVCIPSGSLWLWQIHIVENARRIGAHQFRRNYFWGYGG